MLRALGAALALALPTAVLPAAAAYAAEPTSYTYDRVHDTANGPSQVQQAHAPATLSTIAGGGVQLTRTDASSVAVTPPTGQQFAPGAFPVHSATPTDTVGRIVLDHLCPATGLNAGTSGTVTVHEAAYADGALTALALDYDLACKDPAHAGAYAGSVRHGTDRTYVLARLTQAAIPTTGVGMPKPLTVTVLNAGSAAFTPGTPVVSGTNAGDFAVTTDGCAGNALAPAASCTIDMTFSPAATGSRRGRLTLPVPGHPRATGAAILLTGWSVPPPTAPPVAEVLPTANGPRVTWWASSGAPQHYTVFRRPASDAEWVTLGDANGFGYVDTTLARGETAEYAVSGVGAGGASPKTLTSPITRAMTDPAIGTLDTIVADVDTAAVRAAHYSTSLGHVLGRSGEYLRIDHATGSAQVEMLRVAAPGTYTLGTRTMRLRVDGNECVASSGSVTVTEVLFDPTFGDHATYAATYAVQCYGTTVHGVVRYRSTAPYQGVRATVPAGEWRVPSGTTADRTLTFTSGGSLPVVFGAATIGGADAASFSVVSNACESQSLADGASCDVVVRAAPSGNATRTAYVEVDDDTARGSRRVTLTAVPTSVPSAPSQLDAAGNRVGTLLVDWSTPADTGNSPVTAYRLYRQVGTDAPVLLHEGMFFGYYDTRAPGTSQRFGVAAVNAIGESVTSWTPFVVTPASEAVYSAPFYEGYGLNAVVPGGATYGITNDFEDYGTPAVSPDGSLIAYSRSNGSGYDLFVRNADGSGTPRNLTGAAMGGAVHEYDPAFSNDGRYIAFTRQTSASISVWQVPVGGGTAAQRVANAANPSYLADSRSLVVSDYSSESAALLRIAPNNAKSPIAGTAWGDDPAVSPDGRWIAFARYDASNDVWGVGVVPVAGATAPKLLTDPSGEADWLEPAWRGEGTTLAVTHYNWSTDAEEIALVSWNGTALSRTAALTQHAGAGETAWRTVGLRLVSPPYLTAGNGAKVSFATSAPFTATTCSLDNAPAAPCAGTWTGNALAAGAHTLVVRASGPGVADRVLAHSFTVDRTAPAVSTSLPNTAAITGSTATFRYAASDASGVASYDARYRRAPYNGTFGAFTAPAGWTGTRATQLSVAVTPGSEYCFSVRARDAVGNVSGWSAERCTAAPLDDRSLSATGWSRLTGVGYYRSTYTSTTTRGRAMAVGGVQAKRLVLLATRCSTCGTVAVYMGSTLVANVNLASATTQKAYQFVLPAFTTVRAGTVTIRVTSTGKTVQVDGLGVRRT